MKLTSPDNIAQSEKEFIDTINAELDWEAIEKLLLEKHKFTLQEEIDYKDGDLIVHNDSIAYKFDFEIKVPLSVIFNREGECLELSTLRDDFEEDEEDGNYEKESLMIEDENEIIPEKKIETNGKVGQMASNIADMISEINEGDK
ncbi:MAG: hypothetical protein GY857_05550 [Desulfobacula sp.]|nr:hypothetical protein [Desulfobacula sp.]